MQYLDNFFSNVKVNLKMIFGETKWKFSSAYYWAEIIIKGELYYKCVFQNSGSGCFMTERAGNNYFKSILT